MSSRARRSSRRRPTTSGQFGKAARRIGLAVGLMFAGSASAQQPTSPTSETARPPGGSAMRVPANKPTGASSMKLKRVARFGEERSTRDQETMAPDSRPGWQLRWRKSNRPTEKTHRPDRDTEPTATESVIPTAAVERNERQSRILQAAFQDPSEPSSALELPETLEVPPDEEPATPPSPEQADEPQPTPAPEEPNAVIPPSPSDLGPVPEDSEPSKAEALDEPPYRANPFPQRDERREDTEAIDPDDRRPAPRTTEGLIPQRRNVYSCDDLRDRLDARTIDKVSLDISPPFRPDVIDEETFERARDRFEERQEIRQWRSIDGTVLGKGRMQDLAYEHVIIEAEHGGIEEVPIERISEADLAYISEHWGLPQECRIKQVAYEPRRWMHSKVTWKASALCHKPLYFEEVNLERYGHTAGPFAQPVISSAHFFSSIAVLPYKAGIHPMTECQYSLGYYRPGSCAPWIVPPVPISLRGAVTQATVVASGIAWIP